MKADTEARVAASLERNSELLTHVLGKLTELPSGMRQTLADHLWASIPETVFEWGFNPSASSVGARKETDGIRRITSIYTWCPPGSTGFLQIGGTMIIPVPSGPFFMGPTAIIVESGDERKLWSGLPGTNTGVSGPIFVGLWGQNLPRYGQLAGS